MYHLSAPSTSRNPSLLESLPRLLSRRLGGIGSGAGGRGEVAMRAEEEEEAAAEDEGWWWWWADDTGGGGWW